MPTALLLAFAAVIALVALVLGVRRARNEVKRPPPPPTFPDTPLASTPLWRPPEPPAKSYARPPEAPVSFGYKCSWWAIRSDDPAAVIAALHLAAPREMGWSEGVDRAHGYAGEGERVVFVSPPVDGWVLVVGAPGDLDRDIPAQLAELARVSAGLDTVVQLFATHRVVDYHAWVCAERGRIVRAFACEADAVHVDEGRLTTAETALAIELDPEVEGPDEQDVMRVAAAWSLDPRTLDDRAPVGRGWMGRWP